MKTYTLKLVSKEYLKRKIEFESNYSQTNIVKLNSLISTEELINDYHTAYIEYILEHTYDAKFKREAMQMMTNPEQAREAFSKEGKILIIKSLVEVAILENYINEEQGKKLLEEYIENEKND